MLDPRIDLANMLHELREKLNEVEMKLWEIPHHAEPVEEYEAVFTAPEFSISTAQQIAKEVGVPVIQVSPLNPKWSENLINLAKALSTK